MKADVAIVIVTYNSEKHIRACLGSVFAGAGIGMQVIVVDNGSHDGTVECIRESFPDVELILPGVNLGFAAGVNVGVNHSDSEFVLLLNPDTVVIGNAVKVIVDFARANPRHGLYGGRTLKPDGSLDPSSCWGLPTLWSMGLFACGLTTIARRNRWLDPESLGSWQRDSVREVGMITGCFLLVSSRVWTELGGMDEQFFMYGEDADFAIRARRLGYRPVICPDAELIHEVGACSENPVYREMLLFRGKASLVRTHWQGPTQWLGLFLLAAGTGLRATLGRVRGINRRNGCAGRWETLWKEKKSWLQGYENRTTGRS